MSRSKAEIILFIIATVWAGTFPILKFTLAAFPPFYFVALRFLLASVLFTIVFYRRLKFESSGEFKAGLVLGALLFLGFASQSVGLVYTSSSNSALITGVNVLIVPFAQFIITRKKVFFENWVGVLLVTTGLYLLTRPEINGINLGDWVTLVCAISWAFYIIYLDVFSNRYKSIYVMVFIQFWFVTLIAFFVGFFFEESARVTFSFNNVLALLYGGILATLVATTLGNKYQKFTSPIRATLVLAWETPAAVILSILFVNEQFRLIQIAGAVLMISGILFSESFDYIRTSFKRSKQALTDEAG